MIVKSLCKFTDLYNDTGTTLILKNMIDVSDLKLVIGNGR